MRFFELIDSELVPETRIEKIWITYDAVPGDVVASSVSLNAQVMGEEEVAIYENEDASVVEAVYNGIMDAIEAGETMISVPMIILDVLKMQAA